MLHTYCMYAHVWMWCSTSAVQCSTLLLELQCITDAGHFIS